ncbi:MAG: tolB [candidate division NC10 bacterium]|nr:tolB [candidate division NC10 bacterium]
MRSLRGVHRSAWLLTLAAAIVPLSAWSAEEKFTIDIYKKEAQKIAIAIVGFPSFRFGVKSEDLGTQAGGILADDLKNGHPGR